MLSCIYIAAAGMMRPEFWYRCHLSGHKDQAGGDSRD